MSVSIALCTYNGEKFIRQQIESYLIQTVRPDEVVVCDDASQDSTFQIINEYAAVNHDISWRICQNQNTLGTNKNFEKALNICTGDLIMFSDQDDVWEREKIERVISYFNENPDCNGVFSDAALVDETGRQSPETLLDHSFFKSDIRKSHVKDDLLYWSILMGNIMTGATMIIRRTLLSTILQFRLVVGQRLWYDGWMGFCLMAEGKEGYIDQSLIRYRIHSGQQVGVSSGNDSFEQYIMRGTYLKELTKIYFQRYLIAFSFMQHLKKVIRIPSRIEDRITAEYLSHRKEYFKSQSFIEKKLRLLKWHLQGANYISLRDLVTL
jgi:glycosyltransferase involved in cell wall biosynthesis